MPNLQSIRDAIADLIARSQIQMTEHISLPEADKWILASGYQKAVRRGERAFALTLGLALYQADRQMLWRRTLVTLFEDIGIADPGIVIEVVAVCSYAKWRRAAGGDLAVISALVPRMCVAAKSRSLDHLLAILSFDPDCRGSVEKLARTSDSDLKEILLSADNCVEDRALAACLLAGTDRFPLRRIPTRPGDPDRLFTAYFKMKLDPVLLEACKIALKRGREPMPLLLPLMAELNSADTLEPVEDDVPRSISIKGIPTWALDPLHTRAGKVAIRRWQLITRGLQRFTIPELSIAVFLIDGAQLQNEQTNTFLWDLKEKGISADLQARNIPRQDHQRLLDAVRARMPELDAVRAEILEDMPSPGQTD